jgi:hypothetical protein
MTIRISEYHGRDRVDCVCGICTGEDQYLENMEWKNRQERNQEEK